MQAKNGSGLHMANDEQNEFAPQPLSITFRIWYAVLLIFCVYIAHFAAMEIYEQYWDYNFEGRKIAPTLIISISVTFLFFVISSIGILYRLVIPISNQVYVGKLVGRFITMAFFIGLPLMIFVLEANSYRPYARDSDAKSNLHSIYMACEKFWANKDANKTCDLYAIRLNGFVQDKNVLIELSEGKEFSAVAWHTRSKNKFIVNAQGEIKKLN